VLGPFGGAGGSGCASVSVSPDAFEGAFDDRCDPQAGESSPEAAFDPPCVRDKKRPGHRDGELRRNLPVDHYRVRFDFFMVNDPAYVEEVMLRDTSIWTIEKGNASTVC